MRPAFALLRRLDLANSRTQGDDRHADRGRDVNARLELSEPNNRVSLLDRLFPTGSPDLLSWAPSTSAEACRTVGS